MRDFKTGDDREFFSFDQFEGASATTGASDWAVPWADLMMVMFVLFVVLFIYANTHQDVKVLFSRQSAEEANAASSLDPLIGLIGQISSRAGSGGSQEVVRVAENKVLFRSRVDGVSVVSEGPGRIRVSLRGDLFFARNEQGLKPDADQYMQEIADVIRLSVGTVHIIGYAGDDEPQGMQSFALSAARATAVAEHLMTQFKVDPRRMTITGRGANHPELPDTSKANQAMNRRVEILITNEI
jgi:chemotaxis protein MotB